MPVQVEKLKLLLNPTLPFKTRKGTGGKNFDYITMRQAQQVFDSALGSENWTCEFRDVGSRLFCRIGINIEGTGWVYKEDCGSDSNIEAEKGGVSDAFKRAAVQWGVGRFLYPEVKDEIKRAWGGEKPVATKAAPKPKLSQEKKDALMEKCKELNWDGAKLQDHLKGIGLAWASLTDAQADKVLQDLGRMSFSKNQDNLEAIKSIIEMANQLIEDDVLTITQVENLQKHFTGETYIDESYANMLDYAQLEKVEKALAYCVKHGKDGAEKVIAQYKLGVE